MDATDEVSGLKDQVDLAAPIRKLPPSSIRNGDLIFSSPLELRFTTVNISFTKQEMSELMRQ